MSNSISTSAKFITIEGIEGVGKSTIKQFIDEILKEKSINFLMTREPGGTEIAESIRKVLLSKHEENMSADTELLLMFAGRAQHVDKVIRPALKNNVWVVSDRFTDASFAYQGGGRGLPVERIEELASFVLGDLKPDLTLLLDAPVEVGLSRMNSRGARDRIEEEDVAFFEKIRRAYLACAKREPDRFIIINADQTLENVITDVSAAMKEFLAKCN